MNMVKDLKMKLKNKYRNNLKINKKNNIIK